jgi:hypothetical protein
MNGLKGRESVNLMKDFVHKKKTGRRAGAKTRFHGLCAFAESCGVTPQHAHLVLAGKRESRRLTEAWKRRAS